MTDERIVGPDRPTVEVIERTTRHDGFFRVDEYRLRHRLFNGEMGPPLTRELFERGHAVAVLPYDPCRDEVVLLEQFRIGALEAPHGPWLLEIVAGMIEAGESPEAVARREALEEAGLVVQALEPICDYLVSPGGASERITLYCARVDASGAGGLYGVVAEGEDIRAAVHSREEALALLATGRIDSASPIIALQWLAANWERLRALWCP